MYQFFFNVMAYFVRNLDKMLIGRYISLSALGYYEKSYRLMSLPIQNITYVITPVLHPYLSDFQKNPSQLAYYNERMVRFLAFIGFPLAIYLFFCSEELTLLVFGSQWEASIPAFRILSLSVGFQIIMSSSGSIFQSSNDTKSLFICGLFTAIATCSSYLISLLFFRTIEAFACGITIAYFLCFIQCYWQLYNHTLHRSLLYLYKEILSPILLTLIVGGMLWLVSYYAQHLHLFLMLIIKSICALLIWIVYIYISGEYQMVTKRKNATETPTTHSHDIH